MTHDLGTALHERVAHEHPDLDALVRVSRTRGIRLRRRHRLAVAGATLGTLAVLGAGALAPALLHAEPTTTFVPAAAPSSTLSSPSPAGPAVLAERDLRLGSKIPLPSGKTAVVKSKDTFVELQRIYYPVADPGHRFTKPDLIILLPQLTAAEVDANDQKYGLPSMQQEEHGMAPRGPADITFLISHYPHWSKVLPILDNEPVTGLVSKAPVTVTAPGWACQWYLGDDKASCTGPNGRSVSINIRPATERTAWTSDADKGGTGSGVYTTESHGKIFLSVQPGEGTPAADAETVGKSLHWIR